MHRILAILAFSFFTVSQARSGELFFETAPARNLGGIIIYRKGDVTSVSVGGVLFSRHVKVTTDTPEGPVVTYFTLPSAFKTQDRPPIPGTDSACLAVEIPDQDGMIYINEQLVRCHGTFRLLESPPIDPNDPCTLHVRAVFRVGDKILIEDKIIPIHPGDRTPVHFDGSHAIAVPVKQATSEVLPFPQSK
jgi:hypothetical protein